MTVYLDSFQLPVLGQGVARLSKDERKATGRSVGMVPISLMITTTVVKFAQAEQCLDAWVEDILCS